MVGTVDHLLRLGAHRCVDEVLPPDDLVLGPATLHKRLLQETRGGDDPVDPMVGMVELEILRLDRGQAALGTRALDAALAQAVEEVSAQTVPAGAPVAIKQLVVGADGDGVVRRVHHGRVTQGRGVQDGEGDLAMHVVKVDDIRLERTQELVERRARLT